MYFFGNIEETLTNKNYIFNISLIYIKINTKQKPYRLLEVYNKCEKLQYSHLLLITEGHLQPLSLFLILILIFLPASKENYIFSFLRK